MHSSIGQILFRVGGGGYLGLSENLEGSPFLIFYCIFMRQVFGPNPPPCCVHLCLCLSPSILLSLLSISLSSHLCLSLHGVLYWHAPRSLYLFIYESEILCCWGGRPFSVVHWVLYKHRLKVPGLTWRLRLPFGYYLILWGHWAQLTKDFFMKNMSIAKVIFACFNLLY